MDIVTVANLLFLRYFTICKRLRLANALSIFSYSFMQIVYPTIYTLAHTCPLLSTVLALSYSPIRTNG